MLAVVLDVVYQIIAEHFVYPGEAITVAIVLALVPYLILRGLEVRTAIFVLDQGPIYKPSGFLDRRSAFLRGASSGGRMI